MDSILGKKSRLSLVQSSQESPPSQELPLRIVILKCPYTEWSKPDVHSIFVQMVTLKLTGYQKKHYYGVMPIDGTDFVTDHILICSENPDGSLVPLLGSKTLRHELCKPFHLDFTIEKFFKAAGNQQHLEALHRILEDCQQPNRKLSYFSSWTIAPSVRKNEALMNRLKEIHVAAAVQHHIDEKITDLFGLGIPRFATDTLFYRWGFGPVQLPRPEEEKLILPVFGNIPAVFMHLSSYSDYAYQMIEKYKDLWNGRKSIGMSFEDSIKALEGDKSIAA